MSTKSAQQQPPAVPRRSKKTTTSWNPAKFVERKLFEMKRNIWATFSLGMLEPWEIILVVTVVTVVTSLLWYSLFYHFPTHFRKVVRRAIYYIYGYTPTSNEPVSSTLNDGSAAAFNVVHKAYEAAQTAARATAEARTEL